MRLLIALAFALILALPNRATAEINMADSVEWSTADSAQVVIGRVASFTKRAGQGSVVWYRATLTVTETLKGKPSKTVDFVVRHLSGDSPETWKVKGSEVVLFLIEPSRRKQIDGPEADTDYDKAPFALRREPWGDAFVVIGSGKVYTASFDVLDKRAAIVAAIKAAAATTPANSLRLEVPFDSPAHRSLYGGSSVYLTVAVDPALEQLAIGWLGSSDVGTRERAAIVLGRFKSPANIERLTKLLADPGSYGQSIGNGPMMKHYSVRKAAHDALTSWGVAHKTPVIDDKP